MTNVLLVDWLGRGGIAQTSVEWVSALPAAGLAVEVVTRAGRELDGLGARAGAGRIGSHRAVATLAASVVRDQRPNVVVVQNYVLPLLERPVFAAARSVGARVVVVVHDHQLHSIAAGTRLGLRTALRKADAVVVHSRFVGDAIHQWTGRSATVMPMPILHAVTGAAAVPSPIAVQPDALLALHFGVLKRGYKGTQTVLELASQHPTGWQFGLVGSGSPESDLPESVAVLNGYVDNATLAAAVRASAATLLPYRIATQSGAVTLAQALGSVPVATAVGGIAEQIDHERTGLLLAPDASVSQWLAALSSLRDASYRQMLIDNAAGQVREDHAAFVHAVQALVAA